MKRILAGVVLVGTAVSAQAADMRTYSKAPAMATVYDWTGFYVGVNAGGGLGRNRSDLEVPSTSFDTTYLSGTGALGGGQVGYNWQTGSFLGPIVFGIEADIQGANLRDDRTSLVGLGGFNAQYSDRLDWFGTVRGRIGFATGPVYSYLTGGYAYGSARTSVAESVGGVGIGTFTTDKMRSGWAYGSGVEAALGGNWTAKIEYLYLDLGSRTESFTLGGSPQSLRTETRENIYRAGLNYRFGGNAMLAAAPAANWSGFYIGGNFGGGTARDRSTLTAGFVNDQFNLSPDGYLGGGQIGYNWQAGSWVFGIEADYQGQSLRDNKTCVATCMVGTFAAYDARLGSFGTARGILGYTVGSAMFYATGGYAYGNVRTNIETSFGNFAFNTSKDGYAIGGGIEHPFTFLGLFGSNWTAKSEYLYLDLGTTSNTVAIAGLGLATNTTRVNEHIFRSGINYHFNSPVMARY